MGILDPPRHARLFAAALRIFGATENPAEAGWILPDGTMLDFSGKRDGGSGGTRAMDHRQIREAYSASGAKLPDAEWSTAMLDFVAKGAIRLGWYSFESMTLDMRTNPTPAQLSRLGQLIRRASDLQVDVRDSTGTRLESYSLEHRPTLPALLEILRRAPADARTRRRRYAR